MSVSIELTIKVDTITSRIILALSNDTHKGLNHYIEAYNDLHAYYYENHHNKEMKVLIVFHSLSDIISVRASDEGYCYNQEKLEYRDEVEEKIPIIHISLVDLLFNEKNHPQIREKCARYASIIDSSIWNYYAPIMMDVEKKESFDFSTLNWVLNKIIGNYNLTIDDIGIYQLAISNEYADLNARLLKNSYLRGKAHGRSLSPFLFHSEQKMACKNIKLCARLFSFIKPHRCKWRILFVDDYAITSMSCVDKACKSKITKLDIFNERLKEVVKLANLTSLTEIFDVVAVESIEEAIEILNQKKFDIIILDYLLGVTNGEQKYGYSLLKQIKNTDVLKKNKGIFGKYWFIFASAFPHAVENRLLKEGFSHSDKNWYIGRTSCLLNTPYLFVYNLSSLMMEQLTILTDINLKESNKEEIVTLIDLLYYIFKDETETHQRAIESFNSLLHLASHYKILKNDFYMGGEKSDENKGNGSLLVQSLFPDLECYHYAYWAHLQYLVYLVAYGNIRQWNEMWDEYVFVKDILKKAEELNHNYLGEPMLCKMIENYIFNLKNNNY